MPPESDDLPYDMVEPPLGAPMSETAWRAMLAPIEIARKRYEYTGNSLFAWEGWHHARTLQVPVPDWILNYMDGCAARLLDARAPEELPAALGLVTEGGGPAVIARRRTYFNHLVIARRVCELLDEAWLEGEKLSAHKATEIAAEQLGVDIEKAKRAVREVRRRNMQWLEDWKLR